MKDRPVRLLAWVLVAAVALLGALHAARPISTPDLWWRLEAGEEILGARSLPAADSFSHTAAGQRWINDQWLFDVILDLIWARLGGMPIRALAGLAALGTVLLAAWTAHRWTRSPALTSILALTFLGLCAGDLQVGPEILSCAFFLIVFDRFLFRTDPPGRPRAGLLAGAAALIAFWANVHGAVLLAVIFYGVFIAAEAAGASLGRIPFISPHGRGRIPWPRHLLPFAILSLATLLNANTWRLHAQAFPGWLQSAISATAAGPSFFEDPASAGLPIAVRVIVIAALGIYALSLAAHGWARERIDLAETALAASAFGLVLVGRIWPWAAIVPLLFALKKEGPLRRAVGRKRAATAQRRIGVVAAMLGIAAVLVLPIARSAPVRRTWETLRTGAYLRLPADTELLPGDAAAVVREAGVSGNLFNLREWGGFLLHSLHPRCRVFLDGRPALFPPQVIGDYAAIAGLGPGAADLLDRYGVGITVTPPVWSPPAGGFWIPFFRNASTAVHGRTGSGNAALVAAYYERIGVDFDPDEGFVEAPIIEHQRDWARARRIVGAHLWEVVDPLYEKIRSGGWRISGSQVPFRERIAEAFLKEGLLASAAREFREAHRLEPDGKFALLNLANVEINRGRHAAARAVLIDWLAAHPGDPQATMLLRTAEAAPQR